MTATRWPPRLALHGLGLLLVGMHAALAHAQTPPEVPTLPPATLQTGDLPDAFKRPRSLAILPIKVDLAVASELFAPETARPQEVGGQAEALLQTLLDAEPYVSVRTVAQVQRDLENDQGAPAMYRTAQDSYRVGLDRYLSVQTALAETSLRRARDLYRDIWQDLVDAKPFADAQFMLGVALVEMGRPDGLVALKDAFQIQPARRFRPNFFPPQVNTALVQAFTDHEASADPLHPYGDHRRMAQLAARLGVGWLLMGTVRPGPNGHELWLAVFSAQRRVIEAELHTPLAGGEARIQAFLSRWLACVPIVETSPGRPSRAAMRLDTSGSYALYLRQPTRKDFHSVGFAVGLSDEVRTDLEWFARVNMYTSLSDPYRDLLHSFNSVRLLVGLGFAWQRGPLRVFVRPGLDVHLLGSFVATTDPDCKLFGLGHKLCDPSTVSDLDQRILMGGNLALGGHVGIGRNFFAAIQGSTSAYFLPLTGTDRLNFPLSGEVGLGYRF